MKENKIVVKNLIYIYNQGKKKRDLSLEGLNDTVRWNFIMEKGSIEKNYEKLKLKGTHVRLFNAIVGLYITITCYASK